MGQKGRVLGQGFILQEVLSVNDVILLVDFLFHLSHNYNVMKATVSLKQLRTDPREYIRLLNSGYEVEITEHRKPLVNSAIHAITKPLKRGDGHALLEHIKNMPKIKTPFPDEDTVELMKRTRLEYLEKKFGYKK